MQTGNMPTVADYIYDTATHTASWRFEGWSIYGDQYLMVLPDFVTNTSGIALDGEWTNPYAINTSNSNVSTFPSGDGTAGGAFKFVMTLLPGDADLNNVIDFYDYQIISGNQGDTNALFVDGDMNSDGTVDGADFSYVSGNWGTNYQEIFVVNDLDGDGKVNFNDLQIVIDNQGLASPDREDGDVDGDGDVDADDFDMVFHQIGLEFDWVA